MISGPVSAAETTTSHLVAQAQQNATVSGVATDTGGKALANVVVTISGPVRMTVKTDATGAFSFTVPAGLYSVSATLPGYETAVAADVILTAGATITKFNIALAPQSLQSLRTIGTVRTSAGRSTFNTSALSVATVDATEIQARTQPNLSKEVAELPGVVASQNAGGRDPNSSWDVRGARIETKVTIDGHTISTGVFGTYNTIYANSEIFDQVEVLKGAGINGVNAGESAFGTVNLRTRNFTGNTGFTGRVTTDGYGSGQYSFNYEYKFNPKLEVMVARSFQGYLGPDNGFQGPVANTLGGNIVNIPNYTGLGLIQWQQPLSHPYVTSADLGKIRYNFSSATSLTAEALYLLGQYTSQGASYAYYYGNYTIGQCANGTNVVAAGAAGCTAASTYNAPTTFNYIGSTIPLYSFFPNSTINNQEPQYSAELRTTLKNDTFFLRPYWTEIRRNIDGSTENLQPGNGGGWYQVTNTANCTAQFSAPTASGASGPCFFAGNGYTTPYVNNTSPSVQTYFATTPNAPTCSAATPCYTTTTAQQRNGLYSFGTPFSQPEYDKLDGATFSWLHPVNDNLYTLNVDYSSDYTTKYTADNSPLPAGCFETVGGAANVPTLSNGNPNPFYQPNCAIGGVPFARTPATATQIPPTWNRKAEVSLTGLWQLTPKLQVGLGNYFTFERLYYQTTDPAAAALAAASTVTVNGKVASLAGAEQANGTLLQNVARHNHYDPHVQIEYRAAPNLSIRANGGSSITTPYASLVSGFNKIAPNAGPGGQFDIITVPNPNLQPETTVAYDLGADLRKKDGTVISLDLFDNNISNVFVTYGQQGPPLPNRPAAITGTITNQTLNGPHQLSYGAELTVQRRPRVGFGYYATATLQRAFYYGFSNAFYAAVAGNSSSVNYLGLVNGKQLDNTSGFEDQIPYAKGKGEVQYVWPNERARAAFGLVYNGNNNPYGVPSFATTYLNSSYNITHNLALNVAVENLLGFNTGWKHGQVIANQGFVPLGVAWNNACQCLINGPVNGTKFPYNSAVVVQPQNAYVSLSVKF